MEIFESMSETQKSISVAMIFVSRYVYIHTHTGIYTIIL